MNLMRKVKDMLGLNEPKTGDIVICISSATLYSRDPLLLTSYNERINTGSLAMVVRISDEPPSIYGKSFQIIVNGSVGWAFMHLYERLK